MTRQQAAFEFVRVFEALHRAHGGAALMDSRVQKARLEYLAAVARETWRLAA